jgi:hypothetical protein
MAASVAVFRGVGGAILDCIRKVAERARDVSVAHRVAHHAPFTCGFDKAAACERLQMPRDDRKIDRATLRDLADRARAAALGHARKKQHTRRIAERFEECRIEEVIDWPTT